MKLKSLLVCAAAWLALGAMHALATPASDATIEELLQVTHNESMVNDLTTYMEKMLRANITKAAAGAKFSPEQQRVLDQSLVKATALIRQENDWSKIKPKIIQIYREVFTQEEIEGLLAFYHSPAGQAMIEKMPQVMQKSLEVGQRHMNTLMPKVQAAVREAIAEAEATPKTAPDSSPAQ
jgi:hypothetical protein